MTAACVVVATHDRANRLAPLVDALAAQEVAGGFEVVIVDDASGDDTPAVLARLTETAPFPLRVLRSPRNTGPAAARNLGWRSTRAPAVVFTDDDCLPQPGWLSALIAALGDAAIAQGRTIPDPTATPGPFSHTVRVEQPSGRFDTCNIAYRRSLLDHVGGFDERFHHAYGEDVDLGRRATATGAHCAFVPEAVVHHDVTVSSFRARLHASRRQGGVVQAVAAHPELRSTLPGGHWAKATHPLALLSLGGIVLAASAPRHRRRLVLAAALQVPFLHHRTMVEQLPARKYQWPVVLPLALAADLADVAVLARASLRHRTLVL